MDNVTHSLIGIALGRVALAGLPAASEPRGITERARRAVVWTAVIASSFPDLDFAIPPYDKLGRLLHHRGFTHTLAALPLEALIAGAIGFVIAGRERAAGKRLGLAAALGILFHIVADSWNDYGVHPFWPVDSRWFHGDFVFIIEPLIWMTLIPYALATTASRALRWVLAFFAAAMLAITWIGPFTTALVASWVTLWLVASLAAQLRARSLALALGQLVALLATFGLASNSVRSDLVAVLARAKPEERLHDLVRSPAPANPFCWRFVTVGSRAIEHEGTYHLRIGTVSLLPRFFDPAGCMPRMQVDRTAPLSPVTIPPRAEIAWIGEFEAPLEELRRLDRENCQFSRLLQFARAPFWTAGGEGSVPRVAGDLRYDFEPGLGFSETPIDGGDGAPGCAVSVPWKKPLADLLEPQQPRD